jgi:Uma2 family endonuclease
MASSIRNQTGDPTVYPVEERLGEEILQRLIVELLRPLVQRWLDSRGEIALVGADPFIYWKKHDAFRRVAPDLYVLPGIPPGTDVPSWKVWETQVVPSFALEVVSREWDEDYLEAPGRYAELGVPEVIIFDPHWQERPDRTRFQLFRRISGRPLTRIELGNHDRVRSQALGAWLRSTGEGLETRLRVATDRAGETLFPTGEEAERAAREAAVAEVERLRARVAELEQSRK